MRDERVLRVLNRQHNGVDDGWLCDKGRFAYQAIHADERVTAPMVRDGGVLREVSWERALGEAASALGRMNGKVAALAGGDTTNEEAFLVQRIVREALGGQDVDSAPGIAAADLHALARPDLQASVPDLEFAHTVLVLGTEPVDDMPILDLRIRKGVRRNRVKLAVATSRPSSLDANAALSVRYAPGGEAAFVSAPRGGALRRRCRRSGPRGRLPAPTPCARSPSCCAPAVAKAPVTSSSSTASVCCAAAPRSRPRCRRSPVA